LAYQGKKMRKETWYRVDADYGAGWVLIGEARDRIGYLALCDKAYQGGAKELRVFQCERIF